MPRGRPLKDISQEELLEIFEYNEYTGDLFWKPRGLKWFSSEKAQKMWNGRNAGKKAGRTHNGVRGYRCIHITLFNKPMIAHRVIWKLMTGEEPPIHIDHDDGNGMNNAWDNLSESDPSKNAKNVKMHKSNTSGYCGVSWDKAKNKWRANVIIDGKQHHLGYYDDVDLANTDVCEYRIKNGFTKRHGS